MEWNLVFIIVHMLNMKSGERETMEEKELQNQESIKTVERKENY